MSTPICLGVNIDHVATLRQARGGVVPDVTEAAIVAQRAGAYGITMHLREDRRHIQDADMFNVRAVASYLNMEMAVVDEIVEIALKVKPNVCCLVPEKRQELTTEGGIDVRGNLFGISKDTDRLHAGGIKVSLFVDPVADQLNAAKESGAEFVELHTGEYANAQGTAQHEQYRRLQEASAFAQSLGLKVNAGHGLDYINVGAVAQIQGIQELNIGHSIISQAVFCGLDDAVKLMLGKIKNV